MMVRLATAVLVLMVASFCFAANTPPVASLTSSGALVGGVTVPAGTAVFKGDTVETTAGNTVVTFARGASLLLHSGTSVRISDEYSVELLKGMSRLQGRGAGVTLTASNWVVRSKPDAKTGRLMADVLRDTNGTVSVSVTEGEITAENKLTREVAAANAGHAVLLPPSSGRGSAAGAGGQGAPAPPTTTTSGGNAKKTVLVAALIAAGATAVALLSRETSQKALATQQSAQVTSAVQQATATQQQSAALTTAATQANAAFQQAAQANQALGPIVIQIQAQLTTIQALNQAINLVQQQLATLASQISAGTPLTPEQETQLASLLSQLASLQAQLAAANNALANLILQGNQIAGRPVVPPISNIVP